MIKALFIGLGGVGQRHLRNLRTVGGDVELIAYRVRKLGRVLTDQLGVDAGKDLDAQYKLRVFDDLDAALAQRPAIAFICNPTRLHVPTALAAANGGCHLFIEKPVSDSLEGVDELLRVVEQKRLVTLVGYQLRFHPLVRKLKSLLDAGTIGRIVAARLEVGEDIRNWHPYEDYRQMYAARRDLGGGVILSQIHELDYAAWLFGPPSQLFAVGGRLGDLEIDVEDVASILMRCGGEGSGGFPVHLHQDYLQNPPSRTCQVVGSAGKILLDLRAGTLGVFDGAGRSIHSETLDKFDRNQMFIDEMAHFLAAVAGKQRPVVDLAGGITSLKMALAAKQSLASGQPVNLSL